jgi:CRISPR/Cas system-associated protein Csx1
VTRKVKKNIDDIQSKAPLSIKEYSIILRKCSKSSPPVEKLIDTRKERNTIAITRKNKKAINKTILPTKKFFTTQFLFDKYSIINVQPY